MKYSNVTVETTDGKIEDFSTIENFSVGAPFNNSWNFYDLDGVLHIWNWDVIKKIKVTQMVLYKDETTKS